MGGIDRQWRQASRTIGMRLRGLKRLWAPVGTLVAILSGLAALYRFIISTGSLSLPVIGFAAVSLVGFLLVPVRSTHLFALRSLAFVLDLIFLGLFTVAGVFAYRSSFGEPHELVFMVVAWLWFLYFVIFDWRFRATGGKRLVGIRIFSRRGQFGFLTSFIRAFLTMVVPVIAACWLGGVLYLRGRFYVAEWVRYSFVLLNPISILIFGGSQGMVDRLVGTEIKAEERDDVDRPVINKMKWALLFSVTALCALALAIASYIGTGTPRRVEISTINSPENRPSGENVFSEWIDDDPETIGALWRSLPQGLRKPTDSIQAIQVLRLSRNPFKGEGTEVLVRVEDQRPLQQADVVPILRVRISSPVSPPVCALIVGNLSRFEGEHMAPGQRELTVLQFEQLDDFGLFVLTRSQTSLVATQRFDSGTYTTFADLFPQFGVNVWVSLDFVRWSLFGYGEGREALQQWSVL
jgi:RDD family protein